MPLDSTGYGFASAFKLIDPLKKMGLTPIPEEFVTVYKTEYRANFLRDNPLRQSAQWVTYTFEFYQATMKQRVTLEQYFNLNFEGVQPSSPAPKEVIALAGRVVSEIPDAKIAVDYFYKDPVLHVSYRFNGQVRKAYLAIWDKGVVIKIAE